MKTPPKTTEKTMTAPPFLTGRALEIWEDILPDVTTAGIAIKIESHALGCYCRAVADLEAAQAAIDEYGLVHKTERGITKNPACSIKHQAMLQIRSFGNEFGLTPASRTRALYSRKLNRQ